MWLIRRLEEKIKREKEKWEKDPNGEEKRLIEEIEHCLKHKMFNSAEVALAELKKFKGVEK